MRQLQQAGFTLEESVGVMEGTLDPNLIQKRYQTLEQKIETMIMAKEVLTSLLVRATDETPIGNELESRGRNWPNFDLDLGRGKCLLHGF